MNLLYLILGCVCLALFSLIIFWTSTRPVYEIPYQGLREHSVSLSRDSHHFFATEWASETVQPITTRTVQLMLCIVSFLMVCFLLIKSQWNISEEYMNTSLHVSSLFLLMIVYSYLIGMRDVDAFYLVIGLTVSILVNGSQFTENTSWFTIGITGLLLALLIYILLRTYISRTDQRTLYQRIYPMYQRYHKSILWLLIIFVVWLILIGLYLVYKNHIHPYLHDIISCIVYELVTIGALLSTIT